MIRLAIPLLATLVALYLYWKRPVAYVGFTLWVWFLTPLVRRLVDWKLGWAVPNYILLAPFFVASVSALTLLIPSRRRSGNVMPPFVFCAAGVLYGFIVGILLHSYAESVYGIFNWLSPILFGQHLALSSKDYPQLRRCIERNVAYGAGVMGVYGIYQFFTAPQWDVFWLKNITEGQIDPSFGQPEPFGIRVWSTMNGPSVFAYVMMACLILLFVTKIRLRLPALAAGYVAILLSVVRAAWLAYILATVLLLRSERPSRILRIGASFFFLVVCMIPLVQNRNIAPVLGERFKSFSNLKQDESLRERSNMYQVILGIIRESPFGHGMVNDEIDRNLVVDSGILILLLELGWLGTALYSVGILIFLFTPIPKSRLPIEKGKGSGPPAAAGPMPATLPADFEEDRMPVAMKSICIAYLAQLIGGMVFIGVIGAFFWICLGLTICSYKWQEEALTTSRQQTPRRARLRPVKL
jgi:hypothetical protein